MNIEIELSEPVSLTFSLKYLVNFCKASALSSQVKICLSNEVPLLVEYAVQGTSWLRFYLAPKVGSIYLTCRNGARKEVSRPVADLCSHRLVTRSKRFDTRCYVLRWLMRACIWLTPYDEATMWLWGKMPSRYETEIGVAGGGLFCGGWPQNTLLRYTIEHWRGTAAAACCFNAKDSNETNHQNKVITIITCTPDTIIAGNALMIVAPMVMQRSVTTWGPATFSWDCGAFFSSLSTRPLPKNAGRRNSKFLNGDTSQTGLQLAITRIFLFRPALVSGLVCAGYSTILHGLDLSCYCLVTSSTHPSWRSTNTTQHIRTEPPNQPANQPSARASVINHPAHVLCYTPTHGKRQRRRRSQDVHGPASPGDSRPGRRKSCTEKPLRPIPPINSSALSPKNHASLAPRPC